MFMKDSHDKHEQHRLLGHKQVKVSDEKKNELNYSVHFLMMQLMIRPFSQVGDMK